MPAKKTVKNQTTLPKTIEDKVPKTAYLAGAKLKKVRAKIKALGLTEKDIDEAIRWAKKC